MKRESIDTFGPNLGGKRAIVVGLGISGCAAVDLLRSRSAEVIATDSQPLSSLPSRVAKLDAELVLGGHEGVPWNDVDLIVVSPGVPNFSALKEASLAGVEVIGETELASRFINVPLCAVGGTNGKSTATVLLGHLLEASEKRVFVGGNLGEAACEAPDQEVNVVVFEVSSFQMERLVTFKPHVAVLLNITEDHLDRYDSFEDYAAAKGNCFANQTKDDFCIYPAGDQATKAQAERGSSRHVTFGPSGDYVIEGHDVVEVATSERFSLKDADLHGGHNYLNAAAAIAAARVLGVGPDAIEEGLRRFRALPHRMGLAGRYKGVAFYDDSKATNVGAAVTALLGLTEKKGVLVAGGRDKLGSYDDLVRAVKEKGRGVVLMGEAAARLASALGDIVPVEVARTMQGAVIRAFRMAEPGDAVLLSPACSSLDMFKNYADRGDRFTEAVGNLAGLTSEVEK